MGVGGYNDLLVGQRRLSKGKAIEGICECLNPGVLFCKFRRLDSNSNKLLVPPSSNILWL